MATSGVTMQKMRWHFKNFNRSNTAKMTYSVSFILLFFLVYVVYGALQQYRSMIYIETFLPEPPLPRQHRPVDRHLLPLMPEGRGSSKGRLLCLIVTSPGHHENRAVHVNQTWARHCHRAVFLSSAEDARLGEVLAVPGAASYDQLWEKVTQGLQHVSQHLPAYDWVVKTDDDTFVVVENLLHFLKEHDPAEKLIAGLQLRDWTTKLTYLNGGAGYVMSRPAVVSVAAAVVEGGVCTLRGGMRITTAEDLNMAECCRVLGVRTLDTRDAQGRQRMHVYPPQRVIDPRQSTDWAHLWLKNVSLHPYPFGFENMSADIISFHYVDAENMYLLYYLIYVIRLAGDNH